MKDFGSIISPKSSQGSKIEISLDSGDKEELTLSITNEQSSQVMNKIIDHNNEAGMKEFFCKFNIDDILSIDWDVYLFNENIEIETEDGPVDVETTWAYFRNEELNLESNVIFDVEGE